MLFTTTIFHARGTEPNEQNRWRHMYVSNMWFIGRKQVLS